MPHSDPVDKSNHEPIVATAVGPDGLMMGERIDLKATYDAQYRDYRLSEPHRYYLLVIGSAGCLLASYCYTFALFSHQMMAMGNLNMSQMSSISTVMLVFSYFTLPYAFLYDHFGPRSVLIVGTILLPLGCLLMGLTFDGHITANTINFSVFLAIMGGGCIVFDIGTVVSVLSWFPTNRGSVIAVMKTFAGLGTAIVGTIQLAFFEENPAGFFYFLMGTALGLGLICVFSMTLPPYHLSGSEEKNLCLEEKAARHMTKHLFLTQEAPKIRIIIGLAIVIFLIVFLPMQSMLIVYLDLQHAAKVAFAVIVIVAVLVYPVICLPLGFLGGMDIENQLTAAQSDPNTVAADHGETDNHCCVAGDEAEQEEEIVHDLDFTAPQFQTTFAQSLCTLRLWGIFAVCFAVIGAQLVVLFNYPFIAAALRGKVTDEKFKTLLATLSGVGSAIGRLVLSWLEMWTQHRPAEKRIPITMTLFVPCLFSLFGLVFYIALPGDGLMVGHFLMAIGNGSAAAAAILVFRTIFAKEPAKHYNFGFLAAMVSSIILNRLAYGEWYEHSRPKNFPLCFEKKCVLMPMLLMIGLNALSLLGVVYVHVDYSRFCRDVLAQRDAALRDVAAERGYPTTTSDTAGEEYEMGENVAREVK